jgi:hypothetical protein
MISRGAWWLVLLMLAPAGSLLAQKVVSIITPTNQARFAKSVGMEINIRLGAQVLNPGPNNVRVYFYANGTEVGSASTLEGYSTTWSNVAFGTHVLTAVEAQGTPATNSVIIHVETNGVALVSETAVWKYLDGGTEPASDWREPQADLSLWPSGVPQFGFGDGDEQTAVNWLNLINGSVYPAYYFRHVFILSNAMSYTNLLVRLLRDDGAIVYLNGLELFRDNMPAGTVNNGTYATMGAIDENVFNDRWVSPAALTEGANHLAAQIHNQGPQSHDLSFDLRLLANLPVSPPRLALKWLETNLMVAWPRSYLGYRLEATTQLGTNGWVTITNVVSSGDEFRSIIPPNLPARFFRLSL